MPVDLRLPGQGELERFISLAPRCDLPNLAVAALSPAQRVEPRFASF